MDQQDVKPPHLPDLVRLLMHLQASLTSVNWKRTTDMLHVIPEPDKELARKIQDEFDELRFMLPGFCDGCLEWSLRRFEMPWGAHPHLCFRCHNSVVHQLDSGKVAWPEFDVPDSL